MLPSPIAAAEGYLFFLSEFLGLTLLLAQETDSDYTASSSGESSSSGLLGGSLLYCY